MDITEVTPLEIPPLAGTSSAITTPSTSSEAAGKPGDSKGKEKEKEVEKPEVLQELAEGVKRVLVLGDGTFCFSRAYHRLYPLKRLVATAYEDKKTIEKSEKFRGSREITLYNIEQLKQCDVKVALGFDATDLDNSLAGCGIVQTQQFEKIIFNFPLAFGPRSQIASGTQSLMAEMLPEIYRHLMPKGQLTLRLVRSPEHLKYYHHHKLVPANWFRLKKCVRTDRNGKYMQHGYVHRKTPGGKFNPQEQDDREMKYVFTRVEKRDPTFNHQDEALHSSDILSDERLEHHELGDEYSIYSAMRVRLRYWQYRRWELSRLLTVESTLAGVQSQRTAESDQFRRIIRNYFADQTTSGFVTKIDRKKKREWHKLKSPSKLSEPQKTQAEQIEAQAKNTAQRAALTRVIQILREPMQPEEEEFDNDTLVRVIQLCSRAYPPDLEFAKVLSGWIVHNLDALDVRQLNKCLHALASAYAAQVGELRNFCEVLLGPYYKFQTEQEIMEGLDLPDIGPKKLRILFKYWLSDCYSLGEPTVTVSRQETVQSLIKRLNPVHWKIFLEESNKRTPHGLYFAQLRERPMEGADE